MISYRVDRIIGAINRSLYDRFGNYAIKANSNFLFFVMVQLKIALIAASNSQFPAPPINVHAEKYRVKFS